MGWKYNSIYSSLYSKSPPLFSRISLLFIRYFSSLRCLTKSRLTKIKSQNTLHLWSYIPLLHPLPWKLSSWEDTLLSPKSLIQQMCVECNSVHAMYSARCQRIYMGNNSCWKVKVNHITFLLCLSVRRKFANCIIPFLKYREKKG